MFSCDCNFYRVKNYSSPRSIFISPEITQHVIPESPSRIWQQFSVIFTVGVIFILFFFLSTVLYSIYAQRTTTIKLLIPRYDTRSAAILVSIYRYLPTFRQVTSAAYCRYYSMYSRCQIYSTHTCFSSCFPFYTSLKFFNML